MFPAARPSVVATTADWSGSSAARSGGRRRARSPSIAGRRRAYGRGSRRGSRRSPRTRIAGLAVWLRSPGVAAHRGEAVLVLGDGLGRVGCGSDGELLGAARVVAAGRSAAGWSALPSSEPTPRSASTRPTISWRPSRTRSTAKAGAVFDRSRSSPPQPPSRRRTPRDHRELGSRPARPPSCLGCRAFQGPRDSRSSNFAVPPTARGAVSEPRAPHDRR